MGILLLHLYDYVLSLCYLYFDVLYNIVQFLSKWMTEMQLDYYLLRTVIKQTVNFHDYYIIYYLLELPEFNKQKRDETSI